MSAPGYLRVVAAGITTVDASGELIDLVAVERVVNGYAAELTLAEQVYAARVMWERGVPAPVAAARVGISERMAHRWAASGWSPASVGKPRTAPCGTRNARKRHRRAGEELCELCAVGAQPTKGAAA